jgi:flagellin
LQIVDSAINFINGLRANLGALQNRFVNAQSSLTTTTTNMEQARSRIQDTDFAAETANLTHNQILQQAGTAMLAQANALPNSVLTLLK